MQRLITVEGYGQICMGSTLGNLPGIRVDAAGQVYSQHKGVALMQTAYQPAGSKTGRPKCTMEPGAIESIANGYHKKITHRPSAGDGRKVCRKTRINYHRFHIAKEFDERVANEPKISFRDGHYYVMDGQNTIAARKFLNGGDDLQIRCKVYFNMTEQEEALLFAQQTGISERLSAGQKLRALIFAGEPAAVAFQQATELAGVHLSFEEGRGKQRISCIATAYHEFIRLGPELYIESLYVLLNAWDGEPDSMSSANLLGICRFVELYHSEYSKSRLIAKLRQVDAFTIFRLARTAGVSLPGKTKYLQQVYTIYNGGSRRAALPLKF